MTLVMANDKLEEQLPRLLPGITGLYKRHTEHYLITQVLRWKSNLFLVSNNLSLMMTSAQVFGTLFNVSTNGPSEVDYTHPNHSTRIHFSTDL